MHTRYIQDKLILEDLQEADSELLIATERNVEIQRIEEGVVVNHQLFFDLSVIVQSQGEMIDNIETNINRAVENTDAGVISLEKAEEHQQRCIIL